MYVEIIDAVRHALDGQAILFAGSGFSFGAINIEGVKFKNGTQLRDYLAEQCGYKNTTSRLENVSLFYKKKFSAEDLIALLKKQYSLSDIGTYHEQILSVPWKRIYTTNYDSIIEEAAKRNRKVITPITMSDNLKTITKRIYVFI